MNDYPVKQLARKDNFCLEEYQEKDVMREALKEREVQNNHQKKQLVISNDPESISSENF